MPKGSGSESGIGNCGIVVDVCAVRCMSKGRSECGFGVVGIAMMFVGLGTGEQRDGSIAVSGR